MKPINLLLLFASFYAVKSQVVVSEIDTTRAYVGEPISIHILIETKEKRIQIPNPQLQLGKYLEVISFDQDFLEVNGKEYPKLNLAFTSHEAGEYIVKPFKIVVGSDTLRSSSYRVKFMAYTPSPQDSLVQKKILGPKPNYQEPFTFQDNLYRYRYILIPLFILLIAFLLYQGLGKHRPKRFTIHQKYKQTPVQEAKQRIRELEKVNIHNQKDQYYFFSELVDILKTYWSKTQNFPAREMVGEDILAKIREKDLYSETDLEKIKTLLQDADLVKFAKKEMEEEKIRAYLAKADMWIDNIDSIELIKESD